MISTKYKACHAEIIYTDATRDNMSIHSDVCPDDCDFNNLDEEHRGYLHRVLDEWIDKSGGTGVFYIGNTNDNNISI